MHRQRGWIIAAGFLFAVIVFLVHSIHSTYMRDDEEIAMRVTRGDLAFAVWYQAEQDVHPPLWFSTFWLWRQAVGDGEFTSRVYSVFLTALTLALVYRIGRAWFGAPSYGWFAIAALGCNAYFVIYALEIRPYALIMLVASASMLAFWHWLHAKTWRSALLYGLTVALMLYLHYFMAFLVVAQIVYWIIWSVTRPRGQGEHLVGATCQVAPTENATVEKFTNTRQVKAARNHRGGVSARDSLRQFIGALALALLLWLPWLPIFVNQVDKLSSIESASGQARGAAGIGTTTQATSAEAILDLLNLASSGQPFLLILVIGVGVMLFVYRRSATSERTGQRRAPTRNRHAAYGLALAWGVGVPVLALLFNLVVAVYTPRYVSYLVIGLGIAVGAALAALPSRWRWAALALFVTLSSLSLSMQLPRDRVPFRALLQQVSAAAKPGDALLLDHADLGNNVLRWQVARYLKPELWRSRSEDPAQIPNARRIWFVTAEWFNPAVQETFRRIEATHPLQQVVGKCDRDWCYLLQLLEGAPWNSPQVFGDHMAFWGADVDAISPQSINARLWWRVETAPPINYSIGLHLLDANGALIAQNDGPIRDFGIQAVETSAMQPGKLYMDRRTITLPNNFVGDAELSLVVYDAQTGERLRLADGADALRLKTLALP
jgi:4-amino-4-deoxy-L-arabinose transferase-like glycosyltransferase